MTVPARVTTTAATLRRRAKDLAAEYSAEYVRVFERAADELDALTRWWDEDQQAYLGAIADNRALRNGLANLFHWVYTRLGRRSAEAAEIKRLLAASKEHGHGRTLLAVEIFPTSTRNEIEALIALRLESHFAHAAADAVAPAPGPVASRPDA